MQKIRFLNGNMLKLIAALSMLIDHVGAFLFPDLEVLRCIGRLAFPIFAFMIAEGAKYTKNKVNYVLGIGTLAFFCQAVIYLYDSKNTDMSILVDFTISILLIYALQNLKKKYFEGSINECLSAAWLFILGVVLTFVFTNAYYVDYGIFGILAPVIISVFDFKDIKVSDTAKKLDNNYVRVLALGISLLIFAMATDPIQYFALLSVPLLLLYSEKRGKLKMKYFFYAFYPLHILVLEGVSLLIK